MNKSSTPILVISCDRYADVWRPFFQIFRRQWADCPFPLYLGSNRLRYPDDDVTTILIGDDTSWSSGVKKMLAALDSDYVITFLEDFLIEKRVDTPRVEALVDIARREELGYLRLAAGLPLALPPSAPVPGYPGIGVIDRSELYRVSAQVAIWRRQSLDKLLVPGANAWEAEVIGTAISRYEPDRFWAVYEAAIKYDQSIEKGKWKPSGLKICAEAGVEVDLAARPAFTEGELEQHYRVASDGAPAYLRKLSVARAFRDGERSRGLHLGWDALRQSPFDLHLWATVLFGAIGRTALRAFDIAVVKLRVFAIRRRENRT